MSFTQASEEYNPMSEDSSDEDKNELNFDDLESKNNSSIDESSSSDSSQTSLDESENNMFTTNENIINNEYTDDSDDSDNSDDSSNNLESEKEFETRSEINGLKYFKNLEEAIKEYDNDESIWKISYSTLNNTNYGWRIKVKGEKWSDNEDKLDELNNNYKNATSDEIFWINQVTDPELYDKIFKDIYNKNGKKLNLEIPKKEEIERIYYRECIRNVISDEDFRNNLFMEQFQ